MSDKPNQQFVATIRAAFGLSREYRMPAFVYRPKIVEPGAVVTLDEEYARGHCDDDGYVRCDAAQPGEGVRLSDKPRLRERRQRDGG